ncbi:uncharacterized protein TNCV_4714041 [Trichonephila clavipes]|nr:uncharacterized protein TNCV_4714041 [Trichonephila clavipes]
MWAGIIPLKDSSRDALKEGNDFGQSLCRSITHSGRHYSSVNRITRIRPSWSLKLKRDSSEKTIWCQSACQALCSGAHCRRSRRWFAVRGILYKGTLARNPRCVRRRRIDEANISTPVAVDQRAANCLEEAVRSFTTMRSRCRSLR